MRGTDGDKRMQNENRLFEDFAKLMNGFAGTVAGMGREAEASMREKMREFVGGMDFVSREEFDAVKDLAAAAREEVETLKLRIADLEKAAGLPPRDEDKAGATHTTRARKAAPVKDGAARGDVD